MKKIIQTYFYFSKSERIGLLVLLTLLLAFALAPRIYAFFKTNPPADFSNFDKAVALLQQSEQVNSNNTNIESSTITTFPVFFTFDPNTLSKDSFALLGLSSKLVNTVINYRNKGGRFYQKEDFKKIYGVTKDQYNQLKPYIHIQKFGKPNPLQVYASEEREKVPVVLASFDPNSATKEELYRLGLSQKVVQTIMNYRNKGGQFYQKEDLKKIYSLPEAKYQELAPYISIVRASIFEKKKQYADSPDSLETQIGERTNQKKPIHIDINQATAEDWQSLRGIGPAYAKRITNFRDKLGGFVTINQVAETFGLPDSTFQAIQPFLKNATSLSNLIPLNTCDAKALASHPYLKYKQANAIIAYRNQHGPFSSVEDLKKIVIIDDALFTKISPYLSVD